MCFSLNAEPPIEPGLFGAVGETRHLTLETTDGNKFAAFQARAGEGRGVGMVVMPDVRGLFHFYEELAKRFAEAGIDSVAIDYFGRTAGIGTRDADFEYMEHVRQVTAEGCKNDVAAAVAFLRSPQGGSCRSIFTVGFCFGGLNSWTQATNGHGLSGVVGFYGRPGPMDCIDQFACPVLALFGGADQAITQDKIDEFEAALKAQGIPAEFKVYPGAPHSFFDRTYEQYASESADAWQRMLGFIDTYSKEDSNSAQS